MIVISKGENLIEKIYFKNISFQLGKKLIKWLLFFKETYVLLSIKYNYKMRYNIKSIFDITIKYLLKPQKDLTYLTKDNFTARLHNLQTIWLIFYSKCISSNQVNNSFNFKNK